MLELRDYQAECIEHINSETYGSELVQAPTGSGKTVIFMKLAHDRLPNRSLIIVHREHLIQQVVERFQQFYPDDTVGIVRGKTREWDTPIVVASIWTAANDIDIAPTNFDLVITDECHRAICPTYFKLFHRLGLINEKVFEELFIHARDDTINAEKAEHVRIRITGLEKTSMEYKQGAREIKTLRKQLNMSSTQREQILDLAAARLDSEADLTPRRHVGFTATARRTDDLGLGILFTGVAYQCQLKDLIAQNQLCDLKILPVPIRASQTELRAMLRDGLADGKIVKLWQEHAPDRQSTIAFCMNIAHAEHLTEIFQMEGIDARVVHSKLPPEIRQQNEDDFRNGVAPVLVNVNILIEGFDVPMLDCVIMARDTDSATLIQQAIGRGMRTAEGKHDCLVIDIGQTINVEDLSKSAEIFRKIQIVGNENPSGFQGARETKPGESHEILMGAMFELARVIETADDSLSWVPYLEKDGISLDIGRGRWITICPHTDKSGLYASAYEHEKGRSLICRDKESVRECKDEALRYMLDYGLENTLTTRSAGWRMNTATLKQIALLKRFGIETSTDCTRGEAMDMIATIYRNKERIANGI